MWSDFLRTFALTSCVVNAVFAFAVFYTVRRSAINRLLSLCVFTFSVWSSFLLLIESTSNEFFVRAAFVAGGLIAPLVYLFVEAFIGVSYNRKKLIITLVPVTLISILIYVPNLLFKELIVSDGAIRLAEYGLLYLPYQALFVFFFIRTIISLVAAYHTLTGIRRLQLNYIALGIGIIFSVAAVFYTILPALKLYGFIYMGPILSLLLALSLFYGGTKHHIWEPKVVFSEVWAFLLALVVFSWFLQRADSFNFLLFAAVTFLSLLLIKSVLTESKISKELQVQNVQLTKAKKDLERIEGFKNEFIQMAAEQFKLPIKAIDRIVSSVINDESGRFNTEQKAELQPIADAANRLSNLSRNLFEASIIEQGGIWLDKSETNIDEVIDEAVKNSRLMAKKKGLELIREESEDALPKVFVDREKIYEVVLHLIENALKFTFAGKVTVGAKINVDSIVVTIKDTGIGISSAEIKDIFTKFYQSGRSIGDLPVGGKGAGLGLYISKHIIELHGGKINVRSEEDKGSEFSVSLPIKVEGIIDEVKVENEPLSANV